MYEKTEIPSPQQVLTALDFFSNTHKSLGYIGRVLHNELLLLLRKHR